MRGRIGSLLRGPGAVARLPARRPVLLSALVAVGGCASPQNMLDPRGPAAARVEEMWWWFFAMGVGVSLVVAILLLLAIRRGRQRDRGEPAGEMNGRALVWIGAGVITPVILLGLSVYSHRVGADLYPPLAGDPDVLTVEVVGHQFWWEVQYPQHGITSANEVHIPAGRRVRFLLTGRDVIHSLWIPQLQGKTDMLPGHTTELWLEADEPGRFRGQCAEFCGASHALMALWVIAVPESEFEDWVEQRRTPTSEPDDPLVREGRRVFLEAECHLCHDSRGIARPEELGVAGPDLTHLGSRSTLAAGTLPNSRGNLAGWIADPQRIKPGARMPGTRLAPEEMRALLAYLESLR